MKKIILIISLLITNFVFSQIGINTNEPNINSLLHVSERKKDSSLEANNIKGIIIPRLTKEERDKLTYSDFSTNSTFRLTDTDNSLMIFNTTENCYNYWDSSKKEWKSLCGNQGNAIFSFDCSSVVLHGNYVKNENLENTEYITIQINNVKKEGNYFISVISDKDNGYSFVGSGTLTNKGSQTIKLYAQGKPLSNGTDTFFIKSSSNEDAEKTCSFSVNVKEGPSSYAIICSYTVVNGKYLKDKDLDSSNTIVLKVNVKTIGSYNITTDVVNGISFSDSGEFKTTGTNTIILKGKGKPTSNTDFDLSINPNNQIDNS